MSRDADKARRDEAFEIGEFMLLSTMFLRMTGCPGTSAYTPTGAQVRVPCNIKSIGALHDLKQRNLCLLMCWLPYAAGNMSVCIDLCLNPA